MVLKGQAPNRPMLLSDSCMDVFKCLQLSYNGDNLSITFDIWDDITTDVATPLGLGVVRSLAGKFRLACLSGTQDDTTRASEQ